MPAAPFDPNRAKLLLVDLRALFDDLFRDLLQREKQRLEVADLANADESVGGIVDHKTTVLVVDDESSVWAVLQYVLEERGLAIECVASGEAALELLDKRAFDLIVTDKNMPGISGLDLLRTVRERKLDTDVVLITGYSSKQAAIEALNQGAVGYIEKPFDDIDAVGDQIRHLAQLHARRSEHEQMRQKLFARYGRAWRRYRSIIKTFEDYLSDD